jgi:hypothetical protein
MNNTVLIFILFQIISIQISDGIGNPIQATQVSLSVESNKTDIQIGDKISICYKLSNTCDYVAKSIDVFTTVPEFLYMPYIESIIYNNSEDKITSFGNRGFHLHVNKLSANTNKYFCYDTYIVNEFLQKLEKNSTYKCASATNVSVLRSGIYRPIITIQEINIKNTLPKNEVPIIKPQVIDDLDQP